MKDLLSIKSEVAGMAQLTLKMLETTHQAFREHDVDLISKALTTEQVINRLDDQITAELIDLSRTCNDKLERAQALVFVDVVADLELIGDYCKDILERVQIKIEEKLLFSDEAVKEYEELYKKTEDALKEVVQSLEKNDPALVKEVLKNQEHIDVLVDEYRRRHNQRMIDGVCSPMGCNMFLNMLDFTAAIYYHAKKIARNLLKIKT